MGKSIFDMAKFFLSTYVSVCIASVAKLRFAFVFNIVFVEEKVRIVS